jgi:hypothetical protein
MKASLSK